jgi:hypothetical protein
VSRRWRPWPGTVGSLFLSTPRPSARVSACNPYPSCVRRDPLSGVVTAGIRPGWLTQRAWLGCCGHADVPNEYLAAGADLVAYSGGKVLRGPQSSGMLLGKRALVEAALGERHDLAPIN